MSRILVTGATGFIGSAVVRRLLSDGHHVFDRRIDLLAASEADLRDFIEASGAGLCIHCAWYTNHTDYLTHEVNREWAAASLRLARACQGIRFVGLGTCLEYELSGAGPCVEGETPLAPETLYARSKGDLYDGLAELGGDIAWARVFFVYGLGDRAGRLVPGMMERFSRGEVAGPTFGGLRRDYIHVDDLASQIVRIATSSTRGAINTGTGTAPTLSEIFAAGARAYQRPDLAQPNEETGGQPPLIQADMTRFQAEVGEPGAMDIEAGLKDLVG